MSSNKIKSLKLRRNSQRNEPSTNSQDMSMILAEETKTHVERIEKLSRQEESLTPVHSTPKRSGSRLNASEDQSMFEDRVSPILLPCTQDGGNEVAWDWQAPLSKSASRKCINNSDSIRTPKRTTALQKKRSSNSPLLYKPIKRMLMKNDPQQESIDKFTAEMKALSEQLKTVPREEQESSVLRVEKDVTNDDELLIQIDIADFEGEAKFEVTAELNENSSRNNVIVVNTSLDDFFDDSVEDSMVRCSQEVEEKLKLESGGENGSKSHSTNSSGAKEFSWHQESYSRFNAARETSGNAAGSSTSRLANSTNFTSKNSSIACKVANNTSNEAKKLSAASTAIVAASSSSSTAISKSDAKTSSSSATATSTNSANKSNHPAPSKSSTFSVKVPMSGVKSSNFSVKFPTNGGKRSNAVTANSNASKSSCFNNNNNAKETSKQLSDASSLDDIFEIPDDSFDDILAVCVDDAAKTTNSSKKDNNHQSSSRFGKSYDGPSSTRASGSFRRNETSNARTALWPPPAAASSSKTNSGSSSSVHKGNAMFPRSVSNDHLKPTSSAAVQMFPAPPSQSPAASSNQEKKFFKSKSLSTSSFDDQASKNTNSNSSSSSIGWKSNLFLNGNKSSVSTEKTKNQQANNTSQNNAWPRANGNAGNTGMYNVNRNGPREDDCIRYKQANGSAKQEGREVATGSQQTQKCTPAEIERKRLEAKMRLEAKKKLLASSSSAGALSGGNIKRPVKR